MLQVQGFRRAEYTKLLHQAALCCLLSLTGTQYVIQAS